MRYLEGDARSFRDAEPFDAIVERLVLFHLPDAVDVVRHHIEALRPGGIFMAIDFDCGALRAEPPTELMTRLAGWMNAAFRAAHADPAIGTRLALILVEAGLVDVGGFGIQGYSGPEDPRGPALFARVLRSLAPRIHASGIATEAELDLPTLEDRIGQDLRAAGSVVALPTVVGAFGRRPASVADRPKALSPASAGSAPIKQLSDNGAKVALVDTTLDQADFAISQIASDNEGGGKQAAKTLGKLIGG